MGKRVPRIIQLMRCFLGQYRVTNNGCWNWTGFLDRDGYGRSSKGTAHRVAWEIWNGPIPEGKFVCHHCDNPSCVNPDHLFIGDALANNRDRSKKGRDADRRGERAGTAKLTLADATEILRLRNEEGLTMREIAGRFGITKGNVWKICTGKSWSEAQGERGYTYNKP